MAQGAKGAGRGAPSWGADFLADGSKGEYWGVGIMPRVDWRRGATEERFASCSCMFRLSSVSFSRRRSSTTMVNLGVSCEAAVESRLRPPRFLRACGIVDHRFLDFFSGFGFSSRCSNLSNESNVVATGVTGVAENTDGGGMAGDIDVAGVGGPTSSSPKR